MHSNSNYNDEHSIRHNRWMDEDFIDDVPTSDELTQWQVAADWHAAILDSDLDNLVLQGEQQLDDTDFES